MKKLLIIIMVFLGGVVPVSAAILNPYVVDEKPRALFGDSTPVSTYLGLENYSHDYIGGYLHITFTYTHSRCCFASFPPSLYITNVDPRATSTPTVKSTDTVYLLAPIPIPPGHSTDWYLYDVQFDTSGYTVVVKQTGDTEMVNEHRDVAGLVNSDWASLANLFPMYSPPSDYSMAFTPVSVKEVPVEKSIDPVIIVPGIMGSAYKNGKLVIDPILHTYDDLIATLVANGYVEGKDLFTFPYEWRDSNVFSANLLDDKIDEVKSICGCGKVDIVAHSMGGLVARSYIQSADYDGDVDQVIFLGTPHKGVPTDYLRWESGKFPTGRVNILTELFFETEALRSGYTTVFDYIHNKPILSVQELLPTYSYLKNKDTDIVRTYPNNYPQNLFLENLNSNISNLLNSGVEITNIVGNSGSDTIEKIRVVPSTHSGLWEHGEPDGFYTVLGDQGLERGLGDETVTVFGATLDSLIDNQEILSTHQRIPTLAEGKVFYILTGKVASTTIDNGTGVDVKVLLLQLLSPIDVVVTAPDGKKIGKNFSSSTEYNEIPNAFYSGFQTDNEYITILNPLNGEYKIEVQGTGSGGEYGVLSSYVSDDASVTKKVSGLTELSQITLLNVEVNNNLESIASKKVITTEVLLNDIIKSYGLGWITDKKLKDKLVKKIEGIIKIEKKIEIVEERLPDGKKKQKKIEKLEQKIDKKATKALLIELKGYEKGKINEQAYNIIKEDLEWLINN